MKNLVLLLILETNIDLKENINTVNVDNGSVRTQSGIVIDFLNKYKWTTSKNSLLIRQEVYNNAFMQEEMGMKKWTNFYKMDMEEFKKEIIEEINLKIESNFEDLDYKLKTICFYDENTGKEWVLQEPKQQILI